MLKIMGVQDGSSPTYSIVNEYQTKTGEPVYHFDFYRINSLEEAYDIGYETYFFSGHHCFVEWPEKIAELIPEDAVKIILKVRDEGREILLELPESW
jgi:tRNA threonylcarbamoyladenosine biosynthesis protein TsaE